MHLSAVRCYMAGHCLRYIGIQPHHRLCSPVLNVCNGSVVYSPAFGVVHCVVRLQFTVWFAAVQSGCTLCARRINKSQVPADRHSQTVLYAYRRCNIVHAAACPLHSPCVAVLTERMARR